jgi:hypothetical protein
MKTLNQDEIGKVAGATGALIPVGAGIGAAIGVPVGAAAGAAAVLSVPVAGLLLSDAGALLMSQANGIDVCAGINAVTAQTRSWVNQQVQTWGALPAQIVTPRGQLLHGLQAAPSQNGCGC